MNSLVRDMMTTDVVTVEADEGGRLLGIVSRADLLKVFARPRRRHPAGDRGRGHPARPHDGPGPLLRPGRGRLTYDVDDRGRDVLMTPWLRP
jgi:CBS domain-containing protein